MKNKYIFNRICKKDITEIYKITEDFFPVYEAGNLNQCVIYEEDKKIIFRPIKDKNNTVLGKEIKIQVNDNKKIYIIKKLDNSIGLDIINDLETVKIKISLKDSIITRNISYFNIDNENHIEEKYIINGYKDYENYLNSKTIIESINNLKTKNKTRKRS